MIEFISAGTPVYSLMLVVVVFINICTEFGEDISIAFIISIFIPCFYFGALIFIHPNILFASITIFCPEIPLLLIFIYLILLFSIS